MSITRIALDDALGQVLDATHDIIAAAATPGGRLSEVEETRVGVLGRRMITSPGIAVTSPAATAEHAQAMHEKWEIPVELWAFVSSEDQGGEVAAILLALRARSVVLTDRRLGLGFVEDVQSGDYEALGQHSSGRRVIARARINVRLTIVEPDQEA